LPQSAGWTQTYSYDGFGNLTYDGSRAYTVDPATNRITSPGFGYDASGNLTATPYLTMSYDFSNRLTQVIDTLNGTTSPVRISRSSPMDPHVATCGTG
jgi:hypothetical protein